MNEAPSIALREHDEAARPDPKADKKARELFERGRAAWDEGRYREAWEHWHHSYRLSRKPALLYNVGQAADRLRMDREALEAFRLYLEKNPDAANRKEVENRIRILEREVDGAGGGMGARPDHLSEGFGDDQMERSADTAEGDVSGDADGGDELASVSDRQGQTERKGLYLRGNGGFGLWADNASDTAGQSVSITSLTFTLDAKVGYGITPEVVLGGGLMFDFPLSPEITSGSAAGAEISMSLTLFSVFADYYLAPAEDGWRLFGGLGLGRLAISGGALGNEDAGGIALYAGAGYELPFDEEVAFGVDARVLIGRFSNDTRDHTLFAPALTASAVWY